MSSINSYITNFQSIYSRYLDQHLGITKKEFPFVDRLRKMTFLSLLIVTPFLSQAQEIPADTTQVGNHKSQVDKYLHLAAQNNPDLKSAFNQYLASLEEAPQVGALPDPEIAFGYFINPIETRVGPQQARFSISQMFPWFGTLEARKNIKDHQAKARFQEFQTQRNQLFYEVKSVWYELYLLQTKIKILEENIELLETLEELALQKYETADGNQSDVLQVQIELEDLRINRSKLEDDRTVAHQEFRELINSDTTDFPDEISLPVKELSAEPKDLKQQVLAQNPMLKQLSSQEKAASKSIHEAKLDGRPKFGIGADYILTGQRDAAMINNGQDAFMARATIQVPLWRSKYRAQKKQAQLQQSAVRNQQVSKENQLATQFEHAMRDFRDAQRKLNLYEEKQIDRTQQAIDILTEEYSAAATNFEEILRLQRRLLNYQQSREEAITNQNKSVARIEFLTGKYNTNPEEINK